MTTTSPPTTIAVPSELLERAVQESPDGLFLQDVRGERQSYAEFHRSALRWASVLHREGARKGGRVATLLLNSSAAFHVLLGCGYAGAVKVPINPDLVGATLQHALRVGDPEVVICGAAFLPALLDALPARDRIQRVIVVGEPREWTTSRADVELSSADALLAAAEPVSRPHPRPEQPAVVIFTSGTTGPAKGVVKPWSDLVRFAQDWWCSEPSGAYQDGAYYQLWPTFHMSGTSGLSVALSFGLRLVIREKFSLSSFWSDIRNYGITHAGLVYVAPLVMGAPERPDDRDNPLQVAQICPIATYNTSFKERFGVRTVSTGWGMTEAGQPIGIVDPVKERTCGRPLPGVDVKLVTEEGIPVSGPGRGELWIRRTSDRANGEYLARPDATAETWLKNGWVRTGDCFARDEDGDLFFVDRMNDHIRRLGHNIAASEVENGVLTHPDVVECACVGVVPQAEAAAIVVNGERLNAVEDEDVKIVVVARRDARLSAPALIEHLTTVLPAYMIPRFIELVDALPKNATGKVLKRDLKGLRNAWDASEWLSERRQKGHSVASEVTVNPLPRVGLGSERHDCGG